MLKKVILQQADRNDSSACLAFSDWLGLLLGSALSEFCKENKIPLFIKLYREQIPSDHEEHINIQIKLNCTSHAKQLMCHHCRNIF